MFDRQVDCIWLGAWGKVLYKFKEAQMCQSCKVGSADHRAAFDGKPGKRTKQHQDTCDRALRATQSSNRPQNSALRTTPGPHRWALQRLGVIPVTH